MALFSESIGRYVYALEGMWCYDVVHIYPRQNPMAMLRMLVYGTS